jgi:hypothetical protein
MDVGICWGDFIMRTDIGIIIVSAIAYLWFIRHSVKQFDTYGIYYFWPTIWKVIVGTIGIVYIILAYALKYNP